MLLLCTLVLAVLAGFCRSVGPPKQIEAHQYRQVVNVGQSKKLACPVEANPVAIVQWFKDGEPITEMWERFKLKDGSLRIKDVELEDAGKYVCKATNGFGSINLNYSVIVVDTETGIVRQDQSEYQKNPNEDYTKEGLSPRFMHEQKMKRQHISRPVGSSVRLKCRANGNPRPDVQWTKDGSIIKDSDNKPMWTLKLHDLKELDRGDYTCHVFNRLGSINFTYSLEVIGKVKTKPVLIGPHPRNESVTVGDTVAFQCKVKSIVQPHIQWLKRVDKDTISDYNKSNTIDVKGQKFVVLKTEEVRMDMSGFYINKLTLRAVKPNQAGMYICLGANSMGYSFSSAFLTVSYENASRPSAIEADQSASNGSLPLIIAIPACVVVIVVSLAIFILQRRRGCMARSTTHRNTRFNPVPTQDKETPYPPSVHTNPHMVQTASSSRSGDKMSKNQYVDFLSDISSVSRSHHNQQPHNNVQYGY